MITCKRLSECTLQDALIAWNKGFEGYDFDMTLTLEAFLNRLVFENLSPALSIVAFDGTEPVGLILNGIRSIDGKNVSWNGGTGVAPAYRSKGVGKKMMEEVLSIYEKAGVHTATLEALSHNERAIRLYEKMGYQTTDQLIHLGYSAPLTCDPNHGPHDIHWKKPHDLAEHSFCSRLIPWQVQWQNIRDGEALLAVENGETIGYSLSKRKYDEDGKLSGILLFQCEAHPEHENKESVLKSLLHEAFAFSNEANVSRTAVNFSKTHPVCGILEDEGFIVKAEQVFMVREMTA
ncbi:GNAT family N-acetyltransferase [Bacillus sp. FSL H8-0547]